MATEPFAAVFPTVEYPPAEWFTEPPTWVESWRTEHGYENDPGVLRLTVTDEGRVGGYFYDKDVCILDGGPCWSPPPSPTRYASFNAQSDIVLAGGTILPVGVIGNVGGHASPYVRAEAAQRKYADPNAQKLIVRAVDDERGGYIVGALKPGLTYGDVALLRRSALSGHWMPMDDSWFVQWGASRSAAARADYYDCVAPTLVTNPGLPLIRAYARTASARPVYLGGAGGIQFEEDPMDPFDLALLDALEPDVVYQAAAKEMTKPAAGTAAGDLSAAELRYLAAHGEALPDEARGGAFPIRTADELTAAKASLGRAGAKGTPGYERALAWINKRAKALGEPAVGETKAAAVPATVTLPNGVVLEFVDRPDGEEHGHVHTAAPMGMAPVTPDGATAGGARSLEELASQVDQLTGLVQALMDAMGVQVRAAAAAIPSVALPAPSHLGSVTLPHPLPETIRVPVNT